MEDWTSPSPCQYYGSVDHRTLHSQDVRFGEIPSAYGSSTHGTENRHLGYETASHRAHRSSSWGQSQKSSQQDNGIYRSHWQKGHDSHVASSQHSHRYSHWPMCGNDGSGGRGPHGPPGWCNGHCSNPLVMNVIAFMVHIVGYTGPSNNPCWACWESFLVCEQERWQRWVQQDRHAMQSQLK